MAYKTLRGGRRMKLPGGATNGRQHLVSLAGTVAVFECARGHRLRHDFGKGPAAKRMPAQALRRVAAYWGLGLQANGTRGHCSGWCQWCQNNTDREAIDAKKRITS